MFEAAIYIDPRLKCESRGRFGIRGLIQMTSRYAQRWSRRWHVQAFWSRSRSLRRCPTPTPSEPLEIRDSESEERAVSAVRNRSVKPLIIILDVRLPLSWLS